MSSSRIARGIQAVLDAPDDSLLFFSRKSFNTHSVFTFSIPKAEFSKSFRIEVYDNKTFQLYCYDGREDFAEFDEHFDTVFVVLSNNKQEK